MDTLPIPLLVHAQTGTPAQALSHESIPSVGRDLPGADQRSRDSSHLAADSSVGDPDDLSQTGWCILFASDADPAIKAQLQPLIDLRRSQVGDDNLFKVFEGNTGVQPGQTADNWAEYRGVSLTAQVDPFAGVPYYVLLIGHPDRIPFDFQNLLKMQWAVGRLAFDDIEDYGRYAKAVVQYEAPAFQPVQRKNAAVWITRNEGDVATAMLSGALCPNFLDVHRPLGSGAARFTLDAFTGSSAKQATKQQLIDILRGDIPGGPPAVFFTGSHGAEYPIADPALQRRMQGSLFTQEWVRGTPAGADNLFSAEDIPADARLQGTMAFLFACYSGGCPADNNYYFQPDGSKIPVAPAPLVAALPQALLSHGALAVIAHIDMAFPYAFQDVTGTPQVQAIRDPLTYLMLGRRAGYAADCLSDRWSHLCSQLIEAENRTASSDPKAPQPLSAAAHSALTIARDDARNYIVLGDPAARLRIADLK
uniref:Gingipain domain-containing protein n=2 Tax=Paracidobacterium acidisoli TaxID=2303751 RepID=A0A372ILN2_9BACT